MFEEMAKLESMDYTVRQIRAMVEEGCSIEDALKSMGQEHTARMQGLIQRMEAMTNLMKVNNQIKVEEMMARCREEG